MAEPVSTPTLSMRDFFSSTLTSAINATDTAIPLNAVPSGITEGFLVIDQDNAAREIIYFNTASGSGVTCPNASTGRGQGGTTAASHPTGATVKLNFVAQYWKELQDGNALANGSITADKLATGVTGATTATSQTTASTTFTDLATVGPSVTVTLGANKLALVIISTYCSNSAANNKVAMGFAVSGANTQAAAAAYSIALAAYSNNADGRISGAFLFTGSAAGSTTFTAKYLVDSSGTGTFADRKITVLPL